MDEQSHQPLLATARHARNTTSRTVTTPPRTVEGERNTGQCCQQRAKNSPRVSRDAMAQPLQQAEREAKAGAKDVVNLAYSDSDDTTEEHVERRRTPKPRRRRTAVVEKPAERDEEIAASPAAERAASQDSVEPRRSQRARERSVRLRNYTVTDDSSDEDSDEQRHGDESAARRRE